MSTKPEKVGAVVWPKLDNVRRQFGRECRMYYTGRYMDYYGEPLAQVSTMIVGGEIPWVRYMPLEDLQDIAAGQLDNL